MTTVEILRSVRSLIATPEKWTRDQYARRADGARTHALADDAVCWCLLGAVRRAVGNAGASSRDLSRAYRALAVTVDPQISVYAENDELISALALFNDRASHAEVSAKLDVAIAACGADQVTSMHRRPCRGEA